jgi:hypothetical protein
MHANEKKIIFMIYLSAGIFPLEACGNDGSYNGPGVP